MLAIRTRAPHRYPPLRNGFVLLHLPAPIIIGLWPLASPSWLPHPPQWPGDPPTDAELTGSLEATLRNSTAAAVSEAPEGAIDQNPLWRRHVDAVRRERLCHQRARGYAAHRGRHRADLPHPHGHGDRRVPERDAGLVGGLANTASQVGGSVGLAVLATAAGARAATEAGGSSPAAALAAGTTWSSCWRPGSAWPSQWSAAAAAPARLTTG
jgi:hypothetical protein